MAYAKERNELLGRFVYDLLNETFQKTEVFEKVKKSCIFFGLEGFILPLVESYTLS